MGEEVLIALLCQVTAYAVGLAAIAHREFRALSGQLEEVQFHHLSDTVHYVESFYAPTRTVRQELVVTSQALQRIPMVQHKRMLTSAFAEELSKTLLVEDTYDEMCGYTRLRIELRIVEEV